MSDSRPPYGEVVMKWVRRHPYLALAFGYVLVFVLAVAAWLVFDPSDPATVMFRTFMNTLVYWLFALFHVRNVRKTKQRLDAHGQFRAFVRYPDPRPGSLSGIWNQASQRPPWDPSGSSPRSTTTWSRPGARRS